MTGQLSLPDLKAFRRMYFENSENLKEAVFTYLNELVAEEYDVGLQKL